MHILLCAATAFEIESVCKFMEHEHPGKIERLITGVGLTASTYSLTRSICSSKPDIVIQAGIAGLLDQQFSPGQVVVVEKESIGDSGVMEGAAFSSLFDLQLEQPNGFPWTEGRLVNPSEKLITLGLPIADAVTVNEITTSPEKMSYYANELGASAETLEGAALHYVCLMEKIPFLQIRSFSNFAGERNKNNWQTGTAIDNLNLELKRIILNLV